MDVVWSHHVHLCFDWINTCVFYRICLELTIAAYAFDIPASAGGNLLPSLSQKGIPVILSKITSHAFAIIMLLPAIPVFSIVVRNNFLQNEVAGPSIVFIPF